MNFIFSSQSNFSITMKLFVTVISTFTITLAIRVPSTWPEDERGKLRNKHEAFKPTSHEILFHHTNPIYNLNKIKSYRSILPPIETKNSKENKIHDVAFTNNNWIPMNNPLALIISDIEPMTQKIPYHNAYKSNPSRPSKSKQEFSRNPYGVTSTFPQKSKSIPDTKSPWYNYPGPTQVIYQGHPDVLYITHSKNEGDTKQNKSKSSAILPQLVFDPFATNIPQTSPSTQQPVTNSAPFFQNFDIDQVINSPQIISKNHKPEFTPLRPILNPHYNPRSYLYNNYRDDKLHEPLIYDTQENTNLPNFERRETEKATVGDDENPTEVPTRPIYPGEGVWATRGLKHRPYISNHKFATLENTETTDGYNTFEDGEQLFNQQKFRFGMNLQQFPQQHQLGKFLDQKETVSQKTQNAENEDDKQDAIHEDNEDGDFVPSKLYTQVRHSENEEHLPAQPGEEGRLKEVIKDSKIHTVYTEEGYEDIAYDHAGHEKNAENEEGFQEANKEIQKEHEKKVPKKKYNLHLPNRETISYSNGDKLFSDEEIQKYKQKQLGIVDSDTAASQLVEPSSFNMVQNGKKNHPKSQKAEAEKKHKMRQNLNNFLSTNETKTMSIKNMESGDIETEISGEVRVILQPSNSSKIHKFLKVYPKIYKTVVDNSDVQTEATAAKVEEITPINKSKPNLRDIFIEESTSTTIPNSFTTQVTSQFPETFTIDIPNTTPATTAIPKLRKASDPPEGHHPRVIEQIDEAFIGVNSKTREKRFANDFSNIEADTDFIAKIDHNLGEPREDQTRVKYPYYDNYENRELNVNSPLRYSENLKNIPIKIEGKMSFYEEAETRMKCPEIDSTVEAIPERIENSEEYSEEHDDDDDRDEKEQQDEEESKDTAELTKSPRLVDLGDKIDCLKAKYFGENPLDSPFFKEELIGPVVPIFREQKSIKKYDRTVLIKTASPLTISQYSKTLDDGSTEKALLSTSNYVQDNEINYDLKTPDINRNQSYAEIKYPNVNISERVKLNSDDIKVPEKELALNNVKTVPNMDGTYVLKQTSSEKNVSLPSSKNVQVVSPVSLITTPKYITNLIPKHIYDQIELLSYLPNEENTNNQPKTILTDDPNTVKKESEDMNNSNRSQNVLQTKIRDSIWKQPRIPQDKLTSDSSETTAKNHVFPEAEQSRIKKNRTFFEIFDINKYLPTTTEVPIFEDQVQDTTIARFSRGFSSNDTLPEAEAFKRRRIRRKRPVFKIYDISRNLPTTPFPVFTLSGASTVLPKYKVVSEVFYKDDIKPNEQLNVFNDVLNNIRYSSQELVQDVSQDYSEPIAVTFSSTTNDINTQKTEDIRNYHPQDSYLNAYDNLGIKIKYYTSTPTPSPATSSSKPAINRGTYNYKSQINDYEVHRTPTSAKIKTKEDNILYFNVALNEANKKEENTTPQLPETALPTKGEITAVQGLMPPKIYRYKTIQNFKRENSPVFGNYGETDKNVNKFFVLGMKPPPHQRLYIYSDFLNNNFIKSKKHFHRRGKRNANRAAYAQVSRNRGSQDESTGSVTEINDNVDDYIPHRPKNYYYDEKTGKIIYNNIRNPQDADENEESEEIEYVEIEDEKPKHIEDEKPKQTEKPKQSLIFATATPPPEGQSYIDFLKKVKSDISYHEIPDPTTTEANIVLTTEKGLTTTIKSVSTTPPEFLDILAKLRGNSEYKLITDEKAKSSTAPDSSKQYKDSEQEDVGEAEYEDSQLENVKNSPGSQGFGPGQNFKIFDINEFIPKLKNYLPKTSIDTSKYKNIERSTNMRNMENSGFSGRSEELKEFSTSVNLGIDGKSKIKSFNEDDKFHVADEEETIVAIISTSSPSSADASSYKTLERPISSLKMNNKNSSEEIGGSNNFTRETSDLNEHISDNSKIKPLNTENKLQTQAAAEEETFVAIIATSPPTTSTSQQPTRHGPIITRRRRPTTSRTTRTTGSRTLTTTSRPMDQTRRTYRRRPTKIIASPKTERFFEDETNDTPKVLRRRSELSARKNIESLAKLSDRMDEVFEDVKRSDQNKQSEILIPKGDLNATNTKNLLGSGKVEIRKFVDIFRKYHRDKKHGGNYRRENDGEHLKETDAHQNNSKIDNLPEATGRRKDVKRIREYNRKKQYGGNNKSGDQDYLGEINQNIGDAYTEEDSTQKEGQEKIPKTSEIKPLIINLFDSFGGDVSSESAEENIRQDKQIVAQDRKRLIRVEEKGSKNKPKRFERKYVTVNKSDKNLQLLTDIVPKPEFFYNDPNLPRAVNMLIDAGGSSGELGNILDNVKKETSTTDTISNKEFITEPFKNLKSTLQPPKDTPKPKTPLFIKDPSKRFYFYAPV